MNFKSGRELLEKCTEKGISIAEACILREMELYGRSREEIIADMDKSYKIMRNAIERGVTEDLVSMGGLIGGEAKKLKMRRESTPPVCGSIVSKAMGAAMGVMEVNASMGLIVAAPTAGSCGILPGALITAADEFGKNDEEIVKALFSAAAIGVIITRNATVSGAEGGCQAETGAAAGMAAAGIVELMGGTPQQALDSAAICLKNIMGLICDPIAGLVEAPCQKRNAIGVANALISAELVLAGIGSIVPFDEVVQSMYEVGKRMPMELRETALGGVASSPTGCTLCSRIFK
ncbi:MAG: L-serine ammonia-lyase, iron-sulfur-dependent, subunit alpha [Peptoclostridium sp.]|uniref:L-serine ammonia-lyase, iron-sulfur-dependent, subunit alpha n=1 Tax=Peptoclostridium sp. TaxID=1904860 RepID=UPI00139F17DE|nr:L-serine ammonia-lyase, iron-sulfur-dependent, subunit alpha [Peptoclostridium sp.]MZQ76003.1 L-serine ammonia-lyase, iron-sulfur-dependent, subunit alpha [Peptoclostridium sp.]